MGGDARRNPQSKHKGGEGRGGEGRGGDALPLSLITFSTVTFGVKLMVKLNWRGGV
jgi:hypothetical protein